MTAQSTLRVAIQADSFETLSLQGDTTYALALEAYARGYELHHYLPSSLVYRDHSLYATTKRLTLSQGDSYPITYSSSCEKDLGKDFDVILMRQDPPFDMHYIATTHLLECIQDRALILNSPSAVRDAPEKLSILKFADLLPPTAIAFDQKSIESLCLQFGDCILKPLYGNGGEGILRIKPNDGNRRSIIEIMLGRYSRQPLMVQAYLPQIRDGDKRIILIDGEACGALNRIPAQDEVRANLHIGGQPKLAALSDNDKRICARLAPWLREEGLFFCGIDVIGEYLTEINVTSPTGIREIKNLGGPDLAKQFWDQALIKLNSNEL